MLSRYPHQLSGGMRQRVMIAMALSCRPTLLIADEPTTALDVTIQAQILALIRILQNEMQMAVMFITHDMGVVAEVADRVVVMYRGEKVEEGATEAIFAAPKHRYTKALLSAVPRLGSLKDEDLPRKFPLVLMDGGAKLREFGKLVQQFIAENASSVEMNEFVTPLADLGDKVQKLTMEIGLKAMNDPQEAGAAAVSYLRVIGHLVFAYFWAKMARVALDRVGAGDADPFYRAKLATARFYFQRLLPETAYHIRAARSGAKNLMELESEQF